MVFSSPTFLFVFLPVVLLLTVLVPWRYQNWILLAASILFYIWGAGGNIATILYVSLAAFVGGALLTRVSTRSQRIRLAALWGILTLLMVPLLLQKYLPVALVTIGSPDLISLPLALGISFFTFHAISYVVDVRRGVVPREHNLKDFMLYLFLFPHQIAGPIVRYSEIVDEIKDRARPRAEEITYGAIRFLWGLSKKVLIADNAGSIVAAVDALPGGQSASTAWLGALAFAIQIYFDFSGYSDMAIGLAAMFGFHFPENFAGPYRSASVTEFWRRWHMTLSRWFRDYVYIPMGGNRHGRTREYIALISTFLLTALWHGATWPFLVWGGLHSAALVFERMTGLRNATRWVYLRRTFMACFIVISWVPFHTPTMTETVDNWRLMASLDFQALPPSLILGLTPIVLAAMVIGCLTFLAPAGTATAFSRIFTLDGARQLRISTCSVLAPVLAFACMAMVTWNGFSPFLYFAF